MAHGALSTADWIGTVDRLGGPEMLAAEARESGAFLRPREVKTAVDLLRLVLGYCLGHVGLRLTAAWSEGIGLASLSNVALLGRLRNCVPWLEKIVARLLAEAAQAEAARRADAGLPCADAAPPRLIRLVDATTVIKPGRFAHENSQLWRIHAVYNLPSEQFSAFEITDEKGAERINRVAVIPGEIRIADRIHCRADDLGQVIEQGADIVVRASWRSARWLDQRGRGLDIIGELTANTTGRIDRAVWLGRSGKATALALRLVAVRMPKEQAVKAVADARAEAKKKQRQIQPGTLIAAEWVILVTTLPANDYSADRVLELYRLRWRIEIAFKRLKSLVGLKGPPGKCVVVAKAWVLCHLIAVLLTEAQLAAFGASPRLAPEHDPIYGAPSAC